MGTCSRFPDHVRRTAIGAERKLGSEIGSFRFAPIAVIRGAADRLPISRDSSRGTPPQFRPLAESNRIAQRAAKPLAKTWRISHLMDEEM